MIQTLFEENSKNLFRKFESSEGKIKLYKDEYKKDFYLVNDRTIEKSPWIYDYIQSILKLSSEICHSDPSLVISYF